MLAPLASVLLFPCGHRPAFWYLRWKKIEREQKPKRRRREYASSNLRLRLLETRNRSCAWRVKRQWPELDPEEFAGRRSLVSQYPELPGRQPGSTNRACAPRYAPHRWMQLPASRCAGGASFGHRQPDRPHWHRSAGLQAGRCSL